MNAVPSVAPSAKANTYGSTLEAMTCLLFLLLQTINVYAHVISLDWTIRINTIFLLCLLLAAWKRFDGGRHICFLFLGMLILFQGGRLLAFTFNPLFGSDPTLQDPFRFVLMRGIPFGVTGQIAEITMLAITASAVFIYLPCSLRYIPAKMPDSPPPTVMHSLYRVYFLTFPFLVYKNLRYFLFIRSHGGYLALFLMRDQLLASVGILSRFLSLVATLTFIALFVFERNKLRTYLITSTFFLVSILDLLIGLRGQVFTLVLSLWLLQNIKRERRFHIFQIATAAILMAYLAMFAANFRENQQIKVMNPLSFVASQGISMQVTEAVVGYKHDFARNPYHYFEHEVGAALFPGASQADRPDGDFLADDLTNYLSHQAAEKGYGSGSSYIAEAYLLGGMVGVIMISCLIGFFLSWLHRASRSHYGILLLAYTMPALIYLPRDTLLDPLGQAIKTFVAIVVALPLLFAVRKVPQIVLFGNPALYEKTNPH